MVDVGTGFLDIVPRTDQFSSALSRDIDPKLQQAGQSASKAASGASTAFAALGVVAIGAIGKGISATTDWASEVRSLQRVTGQSAEDASRLAVAGNELGLSTAKLAQGFGLLGKNIVNGSANLTKYGIATTDASGATLPFNEILGNISDKFLTLPKGVEQAAFAQNVFGKSGKDLIPILSQGAAGLTTLEGKADQLGLTMSGPDVEAAKQLSLAQRELGLAFKGASIAIGEGFVPVLTTIVHGITDVVEVVHLIPAPITTAVVGFTALAGGAAALGKGIGFLKSGWSELDQVFSIGSRVTQLASGALEENTVATVVNTEAQSSLQASANSVTNAISTTADVVQAGTTALETNTVATEANVVATEASGVAQVGAATASAKWATQLTALNAVANESTFAKIFGPGVVAGIDAVTASLARVAPAAVLAFGAFKGFQEFQALKEGNLPKAFNDVSDAARLFGIQLGHASDTQGFQTGIEAIGKGLQDQTLNTETATAALDKLSHDTGVDLPNGAAAGVAALQDFIKTQEQAATATKKHSDALVLLRHPIDSLVEGSRSLSGVFDLMNTSAGAFETQATKAFRDSDQSFRKWATDFHQSAVSAWHDFRDQAATSLDFVDQTVGELGTNLAEGEHLTAQSILRQFQKAEDKTRAFGHNLLEISQSGGVAAKSLANSLLQSGNVLAAQVIANAPDKLRRQIITSFGGGETAADRLGTSFTRSIVGPLNDIATILAKIAKKWNIDVSFLDHGAEARLDSITSKLNALRTRQFTINIHENIDTGHGPTITNARGGVIHGATGFITQGPVFQFGEGSGQTFAGKGAEGVIPFNDRGINILAEALHRAMGRQGSMNVHVTVGFDDSGNLQVRKIARDEIDREHDYRVRVG